MTLANHNGETYSVQWTPNGDMLASCSEDSFVIIWNIPNGNCCEEKNNDIKSECIRLHSPNVSSTIANNQHNFNQIKEKPWIPYVIRWSVYFLSLFFLNFQILFNLLYIYIINREQEKI